MANFFDWLGNEVLGTGNRNQVNAAQDTLGSVMDRADSVSDQNRALYDQYLGKMESLYGSSPEQYSQAVERMAQAIDDMGDFEYKGTTQDYLDPAADYRQRQAANALRNAAGVSGDLFSSNFNDRLMAQSQGMASEEWSKAFDRMMADRTAQLQKWQTGQQKIGNLGTLAGLYGQNQQQYANALGDYYSAQANQNNANLEAYGDVATGQSNLEAQKTNGLGQFVGGAAKIAGALFA